MGSGPDLAVEQNVMPQMTVTISTDCTELERHLAAIERGDLDLPTVSAVAIVVDGSVVEEVPVWLDAE